jgi:bleomycin hydrolase
MRYLDKNILSNLVDRIDTSSNRAEISDSIKKKGIFNTAFDKGKKESQNYNYNLEINYDFEVEGSGFLDIFINELERICSLKGSKTKFSKSYLMFWERIERSNFLLENLINNDFNFSQLEINYLFEKWLKSETNWFTYQQLIEKYGIVPQDSMPDSHVSLSPEKLNNLIEIKLKQCSALLIRMHSRNYDRDLLIAKKNKALSDIFNMLVYSLGNPNLNGNSFELVEKFKFEEVINQKCIINLPSENFDFQKYYINDLSQVLIENAKVRYLNLEIELIFELIIEHLKHNIPVIVGTEKFDDSLYSFHEDMYDLNETMATCLDLDKGKRLNYGIANIGSVSYIIGVEIIDEKAINWKIKSNNKIINIDSMWLSEFAYKFIFDNKILNNSINDLENLPSEIITRNNPIGGII